MYPTFEGIHSFMKTDLIRIETFWSLYPRAKPPILIVMVDYNDG